MNERLEKVLSEVLSKYKIKNSRKSFALLLLTLSVLFFGLAETTTIID